MTKTTEAIKTYIESSLAHVKTGEHRLQRQKKPTPEHILKTLGNILAAIALLSDEQEKLWKMHVSLERNNLELEELIKTVLETLEPKDEDWKMKDPDWPDNYSETLPDGSRKASE